MNRMLPSSDFVRTAAAETPFLGESLIGFINRVLSKTVFRHVDRALSAAGLGKKFPPTLATSLQDPEELALLAQFLGCFPEHLASRTYAGGALVGGRCVSIEFFGTPIRKQFRGPSIRRVSPRALDRGLYHRAVWELRPFSFDPETKELLLDTCPNCQHNLRWRRVHAPQHCDKCIDDRGFPVVDLRDYPQSLVEVEDEEALNFVTGLVDPDVKKRTAAMRKLPSAWQTFSNSDIFETVVGLATGLRMNPAAGKNALARGRSQSDFATLTPEMLALAGRAIVGGSGGFAKLAARYRTEQDRRPGHYGLAKELGPLGHLPNDSGLRLGIPELLRSLIDADMAENGNFHRISSGQVDGRDFLPIYRLEKKFGVRRSRMEMIANSGLVKTRRAKIAIRTGLQIAVTDVAPLIAQMKNSISEKDAAGILGLPPHVLPNLAERGFLIRPDRAVLGFLPGKAGYTTSSVTELVERIWSIAKPKPPKSKVSLPTAARSLGRGEAPWGAIISALLAGDAEVFIGKAKTRNIRLSFVVSDVGAFATGVRKHISTDPAPTYPEWIGAGTSAEILRVIVPFFYRLLAGRPDILKALRPGYWPYRSSDVTRVANSYIFTPEIAQRAYEPARRVRKLLHELGIEPEIALQPGKDFGFSRRKVERALAKLETKRRKLLDGLPQRSRDPRVKLIRAVLNGAETTATAKELGINYYRAQKCVADWKSTGAMPWKP